MRKVRRWMTALLALVAACSSESKDGPDVDAQLVDLLNKANVTPLTVPAQNPAQVTLGQALMFDKILSGRKNIACATCHHPLRHTGDSLPLSIGQGSTGLAPVRQPVPGALIPRHAPDLFNRGANQWQPLFWGGRVAAGQQHGRAALARRAGQLGQRVATGLGAVQTEDRPDQRAEHDPAEEGRLDYAHIIRRVEQPPVLA